MEEGRVLVAYLDNYPIYGYPDVVPARHGQVWKDEERKTLIEAFLHGSDVGTLANNHERTPSSIVEQLRILGYIVHRDMPGDRVGNWHKYFVRSRKTDIMLRAQVYNKEKVMDSNECKVNKKAPAVEVKTFVFGVDQKDVPTEQLFVHIKALEDRMAELGGIKNKPKKLVAQLESLQKDIDALVKVCDERE